jgi:DNA (cytosine-5)-methyltransferase 1
MKDRINSEIPILSFFTGGGLLDMGFEQAGFSIVWKNENNELFAKMHAFAITAWRRTRDNNINAEVFNTRSIEEITPKEILMEAFPSGRPNIFGIIGGPPCQDFSPAGRNAGFAGKRGKLTKLFFEYIQEIEPTFFVFENVQNLWNNQKHKKGIQKILKHISNDYFIDHKILNALEFGIPQDRKRLFIIGIKKLEKYTNNFLETEFNFPWPFIAKYYNAVSKFKWPDISPFQNGATKKNDVPIELCVWNLLLDKNGEESVQNGNEYFSPHSKKFWEIEEGNTKNRSFKRLHRYRYSPTVCYGNNEVHLHPFLPRRLSVREVLRIQSVDDSYILPKELGLSPKFKMIANGVPVKLAFEVARALYGYLLNYNN